MINHGAVLFEHCQWVSAILQHVFPCNFNFSSFYWKFFNRSCCCKLISKSFFN